MKRACPVSPGRSVLKKPRPSNSRAPMPCSSILTISHPQPRKRL
nr:MAG TPA: hypothetical protein [Bacteriophage sp.]